jgi:hypothetical protein
MVQAPARGPGGLDTRHIVDASCENGKDEFVGERVKGRRILGRATTFHAIIVVIDDSVRTNVFFHHATIVQRKRHAATFLF